jgi:hypothetical protein
MQLRLQFRVVSQATRRNEAFLFLFWGWWFFVRDSVEFIGSIDFEMLERV